MNLTDEEMVALYLLCYRAEQERLTTNGVLYDPDLLLQQPQLRRAARDLLSRLGSELAERHIDPVAVNLGSVRL